jgi:predicted permease
VAMRHALGASRARLMRAAMIESLLIGLAGGIGGLLGTRWIAQGLLPALGFGPASSINSGIGVSVLAFAFAAAIITSLLFGFIPAWRGTDPRAMRVAQESAGRVASRVPRFRTARAILVFQVAMSVVVLAAAGLLVGTLRNLHNVDPGFNPANVLLFRVDPALNGYDQEHRRRVLAEILDRVRALPGVQAASLSQHALVSRSSSVSTVNSVEGLKPAQRLSANRLVVDWQFLRTMRIPLLAGSTLERAGEAGAVRPVIVNRAFAERAFHAADPIGRRFRFSDQADRPTYEVVGVAGDVRLVSLREPAPPTVYLSFRQETIDRASIAVRTEGAPAMLIPAVRLAVASVDPDLPLDRIRTEDDQIAAGFDRERLFATLASALGVLALLLASIGIYGVIAYSVSRRTTEIGVRLALGARPNWILLMVATEAGKVVAVGAVLGLAGGLVASRSLASLLFGLAPNDPVVLGLAVVLLILVAATAALIPARRAARTDPLVALRHE